MVFVELQLLLNYNSLNHNFVESRLYREATCDLFQQWEESLHSNVGATVPMPRSTRQVPFPVFIPTRGRPEKANLNWEANHVFGPLKPGSKVTAISPLFIVVVEPREEDAYRDVADGADLGAPRERERAWLCPLGGADGLHECL